MFENFCAAWQPLKIKSTKKFAADKYFHGSRQSIKVKCTKISAVDEYLHLVFVSNSSAHKFFAYNILLGMAIVENKMHKKFAVGKYLCAYIL